MSTRREAREIALKVLYCVDILQTHDWQDTFEYLVAKHSLDETSEKFARELIETTLTHLPEIDPLLSRISQHWKISRMAVVDRNVLRLAVCEMLHWNDIPYTVSIDEAIELGKEYSGMKSAAFINGILDKIYKMVSEDKNEKNE